MNLKPATTDIIMTDGRTLTLCLSFGALYRLKAVRPKEYKQLNKILLNGTEDVMDYLTLAYGGYLCANLDSLDGGGTENVLSWGQFMELAPEINEVALTAKMLLYPKKKAASATPSSAQPAVAGGAE